MTRTRLGIPMIPWEEGLHGLAQGGATVFPQAIALAESGDIDSAWPLIALFWFARHREGLRVRWSAGE